MKNLGRFITLNEVNHIINEISVEMEIPTSLSRKLVINALSYNLVVSEIKEMVQNLINEE